MSRQLLVLFARVSLMLALLLVGGCYLVAQPSIRKTSRPYPLPIKGRARTRWNPPSAIHHFGFKGKLERTLVASGKFWE